MKYKLLEIFVYLLEMNEKLYKNKKSVNQMLIIIVIITIILFFNMVIHKTIPFFV